MKIFGFKKPGWKITEEEVLELIKINPKIKIIDVRTIAEYRHEHLNPCENLSSQEGKFKEQVNYLDKDKTYLLYCRNGSRSTKVKKEMMKLGFDDVFVLDGGIQKWVGTKKLR